MTKGVPKGIWQERTDILAGRGDYGECYSSKNAVPRARAFAGPIRKRTFLNEYISPYKEEKGKNGFENCSLLQ